MVTCETPTYSASLYPRWMLTGPMIPNTPLLISINQSVLLRSEKELTVVLINGDIYHDIILDELRNFSIVLLNVTTDVTGLSLRCGLWWEEQNVTLFYRNAAVVTVATNNERECIGILSVHSLHNEESFLVNI